MPDIEPTKIYRTRQDAEEGLLKTTQEYIKLEAEREKVKEQLMKMGSTLGRALP